MDSLLLNDPDSLLAFLAARARTVGSQNFGIFEHDPNSNEKPRFEFDWGSIEKYYEVDYLVEKAVRVRNLPEFLTRTDPIHRLLIEEFIDAAKHLGKSGQR